MHEANTVEMRARRRRFLIGLGLGAPLLAIWIGLPLLMIRHARDQREQAKTERDQARQERDGALREHARLAARYELFHLHWVEMVLDRDFRTVINSIAEHSAHPKVAGWRMKSIETVTEESEVPPDEFERKALDQIKAGEDEVWDSSQGAHGRYVVAFRANQETCIPCHPRGRDPRLPELIGVFSLNFSPGTSADAGRRETPFARVD